MGRYYLYTFRPRFYYWEGRGQGAVEQVAALWPQAAGTQWQDREHQAARAAVKTCPASLGPRLHCRVRPGSACLGGRAEKLQLPVGLKHNFNPGKLDRKRES